MGQIDELIDVLSAVAASEDNEATAYPYWMILNPRQMMKPSVHALSSMFVGPFFSRKAATDFLNATHYRYGKEAKVYCCSAPRHEDFAALYEASRAALKARALNSEPSR